MALSTSLGVVVYKRVANWVHLEVVSAEFVFPGRYFETKSNRFL